MNEKSSCPVLRGRGGGNIILLLDQRGSGLQVPTDAHRNNESRGKALLAYVLLRSSEQNATDSGRTLIDVATALCGSRPSRCASRGTYYITASFVLMEQRQRYQSYYDYHSSLLSGFGFVKDSS